MTDIIAKIVNWFGPFTGSDHASILQSARIAASNDWIGPGMYAAVGNEGDTRRRGPRTLRYVGVGDPLAARLGQAHHKLGVSSTVSQLWLGELAVAGIPGRRLKRINPHIDIAEWALAYFLKIPDNEKKTMFPPDRSCVLVNRWWGTDYETPTERPTARWADVVEWDATRRSANLVWFGDRARVVRVKPQEA